MIAPVEMKAFGGDRLGIGDDGVFQLTCLHAKPGWVARRLAEGVRRDFPGTCIRWHEEYYEILAVEQLPAGVRYALTPWSDAHTMRTILDYDDASEARREADRRAEKTRNAKAAGFTLGSIVTGFLPAGVQLEMESDLGVSGARATLFSAIIPFFVGGLALIAFISIAFGGTAFSSPPFFYLPGVYFFFESLVRAGVAVGMSRPIGSLPVVIVWEMVAALRGKRPVRAPEPQWKMEIDEATIDRDAYIQREPFLALLSPREQLALADRYGFDWQAKGRASAVFLLVFAVFVIVVTLVRLMSKAMAFSDVVTLLVMGYLIWEQLVRFQRLAAGHPAGSVFGVLVRLFSRRLVR